MTPPSSSPPLFSSSIHYSTLAFITSVASYIHPYSYAYQAYINNFEDYDCIHLSYVRDNPIASCSSEIFESSFYLSSHLFLTFPIVGEPILWQALLKAWIYLSRFVIMLIILQPRDAMLFWQENPIMYVVREEIL